jgi:hypothetical protein
MMQSTLKATLHVQFHSSDETKDSMMCELKLVAGERQDQQVFLNKKHDQSNHQLSHFISTYICMERSAVSSLTRTGL